MATRLTQKRLKEALDYNESNGIFIWKNPHLKSKHRIGEIAGSNTTGYCKINVDGKSYPAHHLAWFYIYGEMPKKIDHIDGNGLNNAISNLRLTTAYQNSWNMKITKRNTSGIKGISWYKATKKWSVEIMAQGKKIFLGRFEDLEFAELIVNEARAKYHGEFAREK